MPDPIKPFWLFLICIMISACQYRSDKQLEYSLKQAGANRSELEQVLEHYAEHPEKQKAARFLIRNMYIHFSYSGPVLDTLQVARTRLLKREPFREGEKERLRNLYTRSQLHKIYDNQVITAGYLIRNIDLAFQGWYSRPWAKNYTFEQFCEFILPYRIENEPLEEWREIYYNRYSSLLDSIGTEDIFTACVLVCEKLKEEGFLINPEFSQPRAGALFLLENRIGTCREGSDFTTYVMRALGIPVTNNFYIFSPDYSTGHSWNDLIRPGQKNYPFWYMDVQDMTEDHIDSWRRGKIYRHTYAIQPERFPSLYPNKEVPREFRNPLVVDVTAEHYGKNKITLPLQKDIHDSFVYLGVFDKWNWGVIDIGIHTRGKATFHNLEPGNIYQTVTFDGNRNPSLGYPFLYDPENTRFFIPDTLKRETHALHRKYKLRKSMFERRYFCIGSRFIASHDPSFTDPVIFHTLTDTLPSAYNRYLFSDSEAYRYIRFVAPEDYHINVAQITFYSDTFQTKINPDKIYGTPSVEGDRKSNLLHVNDDDPLTYYRSAEKGGEIIWDFGKPVSIRSFLYMPRNDDNDIRIGDRYELYYQAGIEGWKSLGEKEAAENVLYYENIPENALLWLRNKTRGNEEHIFYMENGKQQFISTPGASY